MEYSFEVGQTQPMSPEMGIGIIIVWLVLYLFFAFCLAMIANKQGKNFWTSFIMAIIPIANIILVLQLANKPWWWIFLLLIPIVNLVLMILIWMSIAERMGRPSWWGVVIVLVPIVNLVLFLILAFGKKPMLPPPPESMPSAPTV